MARRNRFLPSAILGGLLGLTGCDQIVCCGPETPTEATGGSEASNTAPGVTDTSNTDNGPHPSSGAMEQAPTNAEAIAAFAAGSNAFAKDVWATLEAGNQVYSPASIELAFGMAYAGAQGETREQMAAALRYPNADGHQAAAALLQQWKSNHGEHLAIANRLFGIQNYAWNPAFIQFTGDAYGAPLEQLDFRGAAEASRIRINDWVADNTNDRILDLLPSNSISGETRLVLVNAIHFDADWASPFERNATHDRPFHAPGGEIQVPTMHQTGSFRHTVAAGADIVELPYEGNGLSMVLAVPQERDGLAALEDAFNADAFGEWTDALEQQRIALALPKFKITPDAISLKDALVALGMERPFSNQAQFRGMLSDEVREELKIDNVFHKAFIEVDEKGTEAAAATAIAMVRATSMPMPASVQVNADRPFLFFLRDTETNAILFMGRVVRPETE